ncbi:MAG: hypothetical protein IM550_00150 [Microcystis sp. M54BS1]|uniref:hypothetical protein n=1 Tax=unclassified Microcystis TaxID=2643300 RepID=UPI00257DDB14|nr:MULTISPECIES: hypothetical protein [unclassified Microcystis]MCA2506950.1 hypothetical protein [Microcystis sp. M62BS1]MCA2537701.1 hypothetical protein [Microcystis sp. M54BS1]MCA2549593.1 hypothetical protein [Microcystis sp. M53BS1]MCA2565612.1 hypothetical protein [Microcystis sp. M44BS1]MCA2593826.1 hypothetical protein [Microcystis sp. M38BS1]MCA2610065.1 hypothetical protein [Microcystis sp. M27BS1]
MGKNLLTTQVFWGVVFTLFLAVSPKLEELESKRFTVKDWLELASLLASSGLVLTKYHSDCKGVYTPKFLPGRNEGEE